MNLKCIIIDDEPIARNVVCEFVQKISFLELAGEAVDPIEAQTYLSEEGIDLIFLDIQMPRMNGMQFLKMQTSPSFLTIVPTAYPNYAIEGFDLNILDYLVKPIAFDRFEKACLKAKQYLELKTRAVSEPFFFVKAEGKIEKIEYNELIYIESIGNYLKLHLSNKNIVTYLTLKRLLEQLPSNVFIQVHKSFIINKTKVTSLEGNEIKLDKLSIPIGQKMKEEVMHSIIGNKFLKK